MILHTGQLSAKRLAKRIPDCMESETLDASNRDIVIRYGSTIGTDRQRIVLNSRKSIQNTENRKFMLLMLRASGIRTPLSAGATGIGDAKETRLRLTRHYRVPVCNMKALSLFRADGNTIWLDRNIGRVQETFQEVSMTEDAMASRMTKLAVRAVHTLGLDFALVSLGISAKGFGYVLDVSPAPALNQRLQDIFANAFSNWIKQETNREPLSYTMGTDLEFMLRSKQGNMVLASKYLPRKGDVGCDDRSINRDRKRFPLAEVRPAPGLNALELYDHLKKVMEMAAEQIDASNVEWIAGSMPFPGYSVGGHIHFKGIPLTSSLIRTFDHYLGFPIMMIEKTETAIKRRPKYGFLGDVRTKDYGGFEYRTPGSWLVSPEISRAVLCLSEVVANHSDVLSRDFLCEAETMQAFYSGDKWKLRGLFFDVWNELSETETYRKYAENLTIIPRMVSQGVSWNEDVDLRTVWKLPVARPKARVKKASAR